MRELVLAVERAYTELGAGRRAGPASNRAPSPRALAAAGAVASRYLAVGTPRSFGIVGDDEVAALVLEAHRTWFSPRDVRCTSAELAAQLGGRSVSVDEALAADIACVSTPMGLFASKLRRGTHVNALAAVALDAALSQLAATTPDADLARLAAGLIDGRQLDEITVYLAGDAAIAEQVIGCRA